MIKTSSKDRKQLKPGSTLQH